MNKIARAVVMVIATSLLMVGCNMGNDDFLTQKKQQSSSKTSDKVAAIKNDLMAQNNQLNAEKAAALKKASEAEAREREASNKLSQASAFVSDLVVEISKKDQLIGTLKNQLANAKAGRHAAEQQLKGAQKVAAITVRTAVAETKMKVSAKQSKKPR